LEKFPCGIAKQYVTRSVLPDAKNVGCLTPSAMLLLKYQKLKMFCVDDAVR
jgi:hypothetical protein